MDWKAAVEASVVAGVVFIMMEMILVTITGMGSPWGPPRMMAAMVMGKGVLPPPATFDFGIVMAAMIVHLVLSIIYGVILGWAVSRWEMGKGLASGAGALFGLLIYLVNFYAIAPAFFPWFLDGRNWVGLVSHVTFGLVLGWVYGALIARAHPRTEEMI